MERLVNDFSKRGTEILLGKDGSEGQVAWLTNNLTRRIFQNINQQSVSDFLPQLSDAEVAVRATKAILKPLKRIDDNNAFGGIWNEQMARIAAQRLGLPEKKLKNLITDNGTIAIKLRQSQAIVSKECESLIRRNFEKNPPEGLKFTVQLETWINSLIKTVEENLQSINPNLGKGEKSKITEDIIWAFVQVLDFAPKQNVPLSSLLGILIRGRMGKEINIIDLHCLSFINNANVGIEVSKTAEDFIVQDSSDNKLLISQADILDNVAQFAEILGKNNISHNVIVLVIDNDKFVLPGQENNINMFLKSLEGVLQKHKLSKNGFLVVRTSEVVSPGELSSEWEKRNTMSDKTTERLVDEEFARLNQRTLPHNMQSRNFAREIAQKSFLVQISLGSAVPILFEPCIILQKARAHQQATEIFRLGAKLTNTDPIILTHWKDRQKIDK